MRHYNWNGSNPATILEYARQALITLDTLQGEVAELVPHGRDYQGAPEGSLDADRDDYRSMIAALADVHDYVQAVAIHAMGATR
jgi:hypothetical protein